jgi:hypothetical protein
LAAVKFVAMTLQFEAPDGKAAEHGWGKGLWKPEKGTESTKADIKEVAITTGEAIKALAGWLIYDSKEGGWMRWLIYALMFVSATVAYAGEYQLSVKEILTIHEELGKKHPEFKDTMILNTKAVERNGGVSACGTLTAETANGYVNVGYVPFSGLFIGANGKGKKRFYLMDIGLNAKSKRIVEAVCAQFGMALS